MKKTIRIFALSAALVSGCATIIGDNIQLIPISSTPSEASILITDEKGTPVFQGLTPTSVSLHKSDGSYWGKKSFTVEITKEGFEKQTIPITASANGWYIGGNFLLGGLIGWFIVDPLNGGMYTLSPEQISTSLGEKVAHNNSESNGGISIVLLQDVPTSLRPLMTKVN
jgi:hypothetical protein